LRYSTMICAFGSAVVACLSLEMVRSNSNTAPYTV
jgi:hypothetical protein